MNSKEWRESIKTCPIVDDLSEEEIIQDLESAERRAAALEGAARSAREALAVTKSWCPARGQGQIEAEAAIKAIDAALAALKGVEE